MFYPLLYCSPNPDPFLPLQCSGFSVLGKEYSEFWVWKKCLVVTLANWNVILTNFMCRFTLWEASGVWVWVVLPLQEFLALEFRGEDPYACYSRTNAMWLTCLQAEALHLLLSMSTLCPVFLFFFFKTIIGILIACIATKPSFCGTVINVFYQNFKSPSVESRGRTCKRSTKRYRHSLLFGRHASFCCTPTKGVCRCLLIVAGDTTA